MRRRDCFFHIGTHKTGSTALQQLLAAQRDTLKEFGILVPTNGWISGSPGHRHPGATAAQRLTVPNTPGSFQGLLDEIAGWSGDVILTSEAFWGLFSYPGGIRSVQQEIEAAGVSMQYVVYFREQSQLIASWFSEIAKHGNCLTFGHYFDTILYFGRFFDRTGIILDFDYARWLKDFREVVGRNVNAFSYHDYAGGNRLIKHFMSHCFSTISFPDTLYDGAGWTNHRYGAHATQTLVAINELARRGEPHEHAKEELLRRAAERDRNRTYDPFTDLDRDALRKRFEEPNARLLDDVGIDLSKASVPEGLTWREICNPTEFRYDALIAARSDICELIGDICWPKQRNSRDRNDDAAGAPRRGRAGPYRAIYGCGAADTGSRRPHGLRDERADIQRCWDAGSRGCRHRRSRPRQWHRMEERDCVGLMKQLLVK